MVPPAKLTKGRYGEAFLAAIDMGLRLDNADRPQSVGDWRAAFSE